MRKQFTVILLIVLLLATGLVWKIYYTKDSTKSIKSSGSDSTRSEKNPGSMEQTTSLGDDDNDDMNENEKTLARFPDQGERIQISPELSQYIYAKSDIEIVEGRLRLKDILLVGTKIPENIQLIETLANELKGEVISENLIVGAYELRVNFSSQEELAQIMKKLESTPGVAYVIQQYFASIQALPNDPWSADKKSIIEVLDEKNSSVIKNPIPDSLLKDKTVDWDETNPSGSNWSLEALNAISAWNILEKHKNPTRKKVGVIDSFADIFHPELQGIVSIPKEYSECPGSGFEEDYFLYHGAHVCGIIGARTNNKTGINGVIDDVEIHLAPLYDSFTQANEIKGLTVLIDKNDVPVVNMSFGSIFETRQDAFNAWDLNSQPIVSMKAK